MMNPQRHSTIPAAALWSVVFAVGVIGLLATGPAGLQTTGAVPPAGIDTPSSPTATDLAASPSSVMSRDDPAVDAAQTPFALHVPEPVVEEAASVHAADKPPTELAPAMVASADPLDVGPADTGNATKPVEMANQCPAVDACVDRYLWALYQRAPKEYAVKMIERRDVVVRRKGKTVTVSKAFTKLVDQDFGWKDPKAAERAGMSMTDYVIGGMDRSFKLKLFHMLRAAEAAGLSPGVTSGFRDDYRQSIASGLKAASNRSYHGGSLRGGYGHGLAADVVSVEGETRDQRFASSVKLWNWVDAHGKEFGIGRPYLTRDPPHVAPVDGEEYAKHSRGIRQVASDTKKVGVTKVERVAARDRAKPAKRPRTASASKPKAG